jgi:hypothetical protein
MALKDAPIIDRQKLFDEMTVDELLDMIQELTNKAYHSRQLFEYSCKSHVEDLREIELELSRAGIPEDDGYSCYSPADRVRMLAKKAPEDSKETL